ncbi:MAG: hypothetical protein MK052_11920 [Alphaproteobacteria bacterium]|nr:hypothetical protein [Alphaproteobacteria bacterium]
MWRVLGLVVLGVLLAGCAQLGLASTKEPMFDPVPPEDESIATSPWYHYCGWREYSHEDWVQRSTAIFVGTAKAVLPRPPSRPHQQNDCWAYFEVREWLKHKGPKHIWVDSMISNHRGATFEDFVSLKNCNFEQGKNYLVFGKYHENSAYKDAPVRVTTSTNKGSGVAYHCYPNTELDESYEHRKLVETRAILKGE